MALVQQGLVEIFFYNIEYRTLQFSDPNNGCFEMILQHWKQMSQ